MHVHDLVPFQTTHFDVSHTINALSFGKDYPGMRNPLDKVNARMLHNQNPEGKTGMFQYFLKVQKSLLFCLQ